MVMAAMQEGSGEDYANIVIIGNNDNKLVDSLQNSIY